MGSAKYILTKFERVLRVEKVEYTVAIPDRIKDKRGYAMEQLLEGNYTDCKVVDIPLSKMLDEEVHSLRRTRDKK